MWSTPAELSERGEALVAAARQAFMAGVSDAVMAAAIILAIAALLVAVLAPRGAHATVAEVTPDVQPARA